MKENRLTTILNVPATFAFNFSLNPENTPKWVNSITKEVSSEYPPMIGTVYKSWDEDGAVTEYEVTELIENNSFTLSQKGGSYSVRYTFKPLPDDHTEFTYHEWVSSGELKHPFDQPTLMELKKIIEQEFYSHR